jgi:hypothetical protein
MHFRRTATWLVALAILVAGAIGLYRSWAGRRDEQVAEEFARVVLSKFTSGTGEDVLRLELPSDQVQNRPQKLHVFDTIKSYGAPRGLNVARCERVAAPEAVCPGDAWTCAGAARFDAGSVPFKMTSCNVRDRGLWVLKGINFDLLAVGRQL